MIQNLRLDRLDLFGHRFLRGKDFKGTNTDHGWKSTTHKTAVILRWSNGSKEILKSPLQNVCEPKTVLDCDSNIYISQPQSYDNVSFRVAHRTGQQKTTCLHDQCVYRWLSGDGVGLVIRRMPDRFPVVPNYVVSLGKALHLTLLASGGMSYCKSLWIRASATWLNVNVM